jgi:predicted MPP superfamily phosphohydrolase
MSPHVARIVSFLVFFSIAVCLVGGVHYFIWTRLVRDPALSPATQRWLTVLLWSLFASLPTCLVLSRLLENGVGRALSWVAFSWLGMVLILLVVLVGLDLFRAGILLALRFTDPAGAVDPERRRFMARALALTASALGAGVGLIAMRSGLSRVLAREVRVRLERLPAELDGTTIVQLTDVHIGPTLRREFLSEVVNTANALTPDVIAITGDLVDGSVEELREQVAPLAELKARYGVYFVTGNHEYYSGAEEWCAELRRLGIRVLRNERVSIGSATASFDLAGIDDYTAHQFGNGHGADVARATQGRDTTRELVLLAHQPKAVFEAMKHGVGLQLSGHTHGGQIWPWNFLVRLQQPVVSGLSRFGRTLVYVSNGTGYWGPPMRLGAPAEVTKIVLQAPLEVAV